MASLSTCHLGLWLGWQILLKIIYENGLYHHACKASNHQDWLTFKSFERSVAQELRKALWSYINQVLLQSLEENNTRLFWRSIKSQRKEKLSLRESGVVHTGSAIKTNILNKQFQSVFTKDDGMVYLKFR